MNEKIRKKEVELKRNLKKLYKEMYFDVESELINLAVKYSDYEGKIKVSDIRKYNRLTQLRKKLSNKINIKHKDMKSMIITDLIDSFKLGFYDTLTFMGDQAGINLGNIFLNDELIQHALDHKIKNLTLSDRLERNRKVVIKSTIQVISKNLVLGKGIQDIAKGIKKIYEGDMNKSLNIARTETTRIFNSAKNEAYKAAKKKGLKFDEKWVSTKGDRTRDKHKKLHGQIKGEDGYYRIGKYKAKHPGNFGHAEMDCNCRCTTVAVFNI